MQTDASPLIITIPGWIDELVRAAGSLADERDCMLLTIALSRENVLRGGGPFGALVYADGHVLAAGVNRVLDSGQSIAHAEIVAMMRTQQMLQQGGKQTGPATLFASTEPCCQCFGALVWSGVTRLVCAATTADAEAIGFDEGPKPEAWTKTLEARGISVQLGLCSPEARDVLDEYKRRGGPIYGLRSPTVSA
jgi:tRNA(Arg) A34 adenosine deaminase TadA